MREIRFLLGKKIKKLRHKMQLSQQQLAELVNIETVSMSNIERGLSFPSRNLLELANALNVTLPELFDFESLKLDRKNIIEKIVKEFEFLDDEKLYKTYQFIKLIK